MVTAQEIADRFWLDTSEKADLVRAISKAIMDEREACAQIADSYSQVDGGARVVGLNIGHMIRHR